MYYELKLFEVIHALKNWHHYFYGVEFEVVVDHKSIKWFIAQKDLQGRKVRQIKILQDFDCQLWYHKGQQNVAIDALSCMPKVANLSYMKLRNDLLATLGSNYEHD